MNDLAEIITIEQGKTLADAKGEMQRGIEVVEFACGIPHLLKGSFSENVATPKISDGLRSRINDNFQKLDYAF